MAPLGLVAPATNGAHAAATREDAGALMTAILPDLCAAKGRSKSILVPKASKEAAGSSCRAPGKPPRVRGGAGTLGDVCAGSSFVVGPRGIAQECSGVEAARSGRGSGVVESGRSNEGDGSKAAKGVCGDGRSDREAAGDSGRGDGDAGDGGGSAGQDSRDSEEVSRKREMVTDAGERSRAAGGGVRGGRGGLLVLQDDVLKHILIRVRSHREVAR